MVRMVEDIKRIDHSSARYQQELCGLILLEAKDVETVKRPPCGVPAKVGVAVTGREAVKLCAQ